MKLLISVILLLGPSSLAFAGLEEIRIMTVALRQSDDHSTESIEFLPTTGPDREQSPIEDAKADQAKEPNPLVLLSIESSSAGQPSAQRLVKRTKVSEPIFSLAASELGAPAGSPSQSENSAAAFRTAFSFPTPTGYGVIGAIGLLMIVVQRRLRLGS